MGLRESRIINEVHPWLGARLRWLGEVAEIVGSSQSLISGNRSLTEQLELYNTVAGRPVAYPGCSQHNYGFAADAVWAVAAQITHKGRAKVFTTKETNEFMGSAARHAGLTTVSRDPGHVQMYPGSQFFSWSVSRGLCNPNPPVSRLRQEIHGFAHREISSIVETALRITINQFTGGL